MQVPETPRLRPQLSLTVDPFWLAEKLDRSYVERLLLSKIDSNEVEEEEFDDHHDLPHKFKIIDVRDSKDYAGGNIKGSFNIPYTSFSADTILEMITEEFLGAQEADDAEEGLIIFCCMHSTVRGPRAAFQVLDAMRENPKFIQKGNGRPRVRIGLLSGGFNGWINSYSNTPREDILTENFEAEHWVKKGEDGKLVHIVDNADWEMPEAEVGWEPDAECCDIEIFPSKA